MMSVTAPPGGGAPPRSGGPGPDRQPGAGLPGNAPPSHPEGESLRRRLTGNTFWNGVRLLTTGIGSLVISSLIARLLGPRGMGQYTYLFWWSGTIATLAQVGLLETTTRFVARAIGAGEWDAVGGIVRCLLRSQAALIAALTLLLVPLVVGFHGHLTGSVGLDLAAVAALALPTLFAGIYIAALTAAEQYRSLALSAAAVTLAQAAAVRALGIRASLALPSPFRGGGAPPPAPPEGWCGGPGGVPLGPAREMLALAALAAVASLLISAALYYRMIRARGVVPRLPSSLRRELGAFALDMVGIVLLNAIVWQRSEVLLLKLWSTPEQIAYYNIAYDLGAKLSGIPVVVSSQCWVLFPSLLGAGRQEELRRYYGGMAHSLAVVTLPFFFGAAALAPLFVPLLYTHRYGGAISPTQVLLAGNGAGILSHVAMAYLAASGHLRAAVRITGVMAGVNLGLGWLLVPRFGALGAAFSNSATQLLAAAGYAAWIQWRRGVPFPWRALAGIAAAAALLWVVAHSVHRTVGGFLGAAMGLAGGAATYLAICIAFRVLRPPSGATRGGRDSDASDKGWANPVPAARSGSSPGIHAREAGPYPAPLPEGRLKNAQNPPDRPLEHNDQLPAGPSSLAMNDRSVLHETSMPGPGLSKPASDTQPALAGFPSDRPVVYGRGTQGAGDPTAFPASGNCRRHSRLPSAIRRGLLAVANRLAAALPPTRGYALRRALYRLAGVELARNVRIVGGARIVTADVSIGENSFVNTEVLLCAGGDARIRIGRNVDLGPRCCLVTGTHEIGGPDHRAGAGCARDIEIGDGTWLGANVTVIAGVTIGPGCVVGAGCVVIRDLPPHVLAAGNPARVIRPLPNDE